MNTHRVRCAFVDQQTRGERGECFLAAFVDLRTVLLTLFATLCVIHEKTFSFKSSELHSEQPDLAQIWFVSFIYDNGQIDI